MLITNYHVFTLELQQPSYYFTKRERTAQKLTVIDPPIKDYLITSKNAKKGMQKTFVDKNVFNGNIKILCNFMTFYSRSK